MLSMMQVIINKKVLKYVESDLEEYIKNILVLWIIDIYIFFIYRKYKKNQGHM